MAMSLLISDDEIVTVRAGCESVLLGASLSIAIHNTVCTHGEHCPEVRELRLAEDSARSLLRKLGVSVDSPQEAPTPSHSPK